MVSRLFFHKTSAIRQFGAAFSNAGFMGIPLVQMTLGDSAVFYVASFVAILNILQWTYGVFTGIIGTIASMNGPLAIIVLGAYLAQVPLAELFRTG